MGTQVVLSASPKCPKCGHREKVRRLTEEERIIHVGRDLVCTRQHFSGYLVRTTKPYYFRAPVLSRF